MKCEGCLKRVKEYIICTSGVCKKTFCCLCVNFKTLTPGRKNTWICPDCLSKNKKGGDNSSTPIRNNNLLVEDQNVTYRKKATSDPGYLQDLEPELSTKTEIKELIVEMRSLTQEISMLKEKLETATTSLTRCHERLDHLQTVVSATEDRVDKIAAEQKLIPQLNTQIIELQQELKQQAQDHLRNELEITGLPENQIENLTHIVLVVAKKIGVELEERDIDWIQRMGPPRKANADPSEKRYPRSIVLRLLRREKRDIVLKAARVRRNLMSADVDVPGPSSKIFINERLTKDNRILFREARNVSKQNNYAYCFCSQGKIYIRKREGIPAIHIRSFADLPDCSMAEA